MKLMIKREGNQAKKDKLAGKHHEGNIDDAEMAVIETGKLISAQTPHQMARNLIGDQIHVMLPIMTLDTRERHLAS